MEPEAKERLSRVKLVKPNLVEQVENYLINLFLAGKINKKIGENEIIEVLKRLNR
ncbi:MAG: DNA-binding protein [Candidatus Aenigmarchaeota archaeon]|nr:DNA-binding protein [Candidatus Aenigmarchaeota archaeon]MCX8190884.1 DNA-binding protein [Candidatus Aenigmarchaeota archaeon]